MTLGELATKVNAALAVGIHPTSKVYVSDGPYQTTKPVHEGKVTTVEKARRFIKDDGSNRYIRDEKDANAIIFLLDIFY